MPAALRNLACCCVLLFCLGCDDMCGGGVVATYPSPDGRHTAIQFLQSCGATTLGSFVVSIEPGHISLPPGRSDLADLRHAVLQLRDTTPPVWDDKGELIDPDQVYRLEVEWTGNDTLQIRYSDAGRVERRKTTWNGITVRHIPRGPVNGSGPGSQ